ncbi:hypothetical protein Vadar_021141 [Vaccinium darrowii]|uniref:Uncharacterized protein n=1 Tax=Vaccinium darrowii TaxID=229202 RepID=A0ACB7Y0J8_9ERIC|nr:hypothetical protein Vadar_021141 [Vaccinium darrowii]
MDFLVIEMGWKPAAIARVPSVLSWTIPRCSVIEVLLTKKDVSLAFPLFLSKAKSINSGTSLSPSKRKMFPNCWIFSLEKFTRKRVGAFQLHVWKPFVYILLILSALPAYDRPPLTGTIFNAILALPQLATISGELQPIDGFPAAVFGMISLFYKRNIVPKIATLRELNVPASTLSYLVTYHPIVLLYSFKKFDKTVKKVVETVHKPLRVVFVDVLMMMFGLSKSTWEHKMEVFRKCGWSEDDLKLALEKCPRCMKLSEKKIMSAMDLLVNEMGWKPAAIAKVPGVLRFSVKRRIIPRCLVLKVLISKGLISKDLSISYVLTMSEKFFLDRFVTKYAEAVPQLLDVFNGKVSLAELGIKSEETIVASQLHV